MCFKKGSKSFKKSSSKISLFDREAKSIGGSINLKQQLPNFDTLRDLGISCDGNKVTMTVTKVDKIFFNGKIFSFSNFTILKEK